MLLGGLLEKILINEPAITPVFEPDVSYKELKFMLKRGFLSDKIAEFLNLPLNEKQRLRGMAVTRLSYLPPMEETYSAETILYLCEVLIHWKEQMEDVLVNLKQLKIPLPPDLLEATIRTYIQYKEDVFFHHSPPKTHPEINKIQWKIYRDVLYASSQGKFKLISKEELPDLSNKTYIDTFIITQKSDIPACRNHVKARLIEMGYKPKVIMNWLLALSEAITNVIVHAIQGSMTLLIKSETDEIIFIVNDHGPGFNLEALPNSILLAGFSSKKSLGHGFTFMIKLANQVQLYTTPIGSTVILKFKTNEPTIPSLPFAEKKRGSHDGLIHGD
ncbi:ATP-binding protein [Alkalicoccobacillus porphyridii]|uniref:ATP-binding protein n=1 Tax=Alkalicoccobacillus porphyridii TaxID=2597270 RepID=A0A554A1M0_9BACI|nr:ATP-binding protein [Alkalicoccobacillus porphyridii]TSB47588.1 ATP-binding protein [Alkalicoccobacillus porphyridii]